MRHLSNRTAAALIVACVGLVSACASQGPPRPPLPTAEERARFGTVGVVASEPATRATPVEPPRGVGSATGRGMARGALAGAVGGAYVGTAAGPLAILAVPAFAIVGAVGGATVGGVAGAAQSRSSEEVDEASATIERVLREAEPAREVRAALIRRVSGRRPHDMLAIDQPSGAAAYQELADRGVNSILWLDVRQAGLSSPSSRRRTAPVHPYAHLSFNVTATLRSVPGGARIYGRQWTHISETHRYFRWAEDDGALLRRELDATYAEIAARIADDLFLGAPGPARVTGGETGTVRDDGTGRRRTTGRGSAGDETTVGDRSASGREAPTCPNVYGHQMGLPQPGCE